MNQDVERLKAELKAQGLTVRPGGKHWRVELPDGRFVWTLPNTPSCPRALRNARTRIRRRLRELGAGGRS